REHSAFFHHRREAQIRPSAHWFQGRPETNHRRYRRQQRFLMKGEKQPDNALQPAEAVRAIGHDAQRMSLLFRYGVRTGNDVIGWADSAIVELDSPPDSLIELSMTAPEKTEDI